jgi:hypothetical protein
MAAFAPKLTLRDLFWLTLVAALLIAWWLDRARSEAQIKDLHERIMLISPVRVPQWETPADPLTPP